MNSEKNLKNIYLITGSIMSIIMIGMNIFIPLTTWTGSLFSTL